MKNIVITNLDGSTIIQDSTNSICIINEKKFINGKEIKYTYKEKIEEEIKLIEEEINCLKSKIEQLKKGIENEE